MGFALKVPSLELIPNGGTVPVIPPFWVLRIASDIRIEISLPDKPISKLHYAGQYNHDEANALGYLFLALTDVGNIQAIFSINEFVPPSIEFTRLAASEMSIIYKGALQTVFPVATAGNKPFLGYIAIVA